jgi:hypothetical protein
MARTARVTIPDCPHHITHRGNLRAEAFFNDAGVLKKVIVVGLCGTLLSAHLLPGQVPNDGSALMERREVLRKRVLLPVDDAGSSAVIAIIRTDTPRLSMSEIRNRQYDPESFRRTLLAVWPSGKGLYTSNPTEKKSDLHQTVLTVSRVNKLLEELKCDGAFESEYSVWNCASPGASLVEIVVHCQFGLIRIQMNWVDYRDRVLGEADKTGGDGVFRLARLVDRGSRAAMQSMRESTTVSSSTVRILPEQVCQ